ncbi:hypothetical protein HDU76_013525 [Blyttiomyces sp. JEL0837]|nr:hypothetical protein HDU76_013525 [Blyttiomyces sp. JEL0837]
MFPVPGIEVYLGDTLILNVHNSLDKPTSLHAHGLFQIGNVLYDGPAMVTQCPIPPGGDFTYIIPIQQSGTYWIHAHMKGQYVDGLRAPLIIKKVNETFKYDSEYTLTVTDWYHEEHDVLLQRFMSVYNPNGDEPIPQRPLFNDMSGVELFFETGKTYRLRFICVGAIAMHSIYIDGHDIALIEMDGVKYPRNPFIYVIRDYFLILINTETHTNVSTST